MKNMKLLRNKEDFKAGDLRSDLGVINTWKGRKVRYFKGKEYLVIDVAWHTENEEYVVIYKALYGDCKLK